MSKFKKGDTVECISDITDCTAGKHYKVIKVDDDGNFVINDDVGDIEAHSDSCFKLVTNNLTNNMTDLKEKFSLLYKSVQEKSFRKAGITDGDGLLTEDGRAIFLSYLLKQYGEAFKKDIVDPILEEEKKK